MEGNYAMEKYAHLKDDINRKDFNYEFPQALYYVIKSYTEDDVKTVTNTLTERRDIHG